MGTDEMSKKWPREPDESPEAYAARILRQSHLANQAAMLEQAGAVMHPDGKAFGLVMSDLPSFSPSCRHERI